MTHMKSFINSKNLHRRIFRQDTKWSSDWYALKNVSQISIIHHRDRVFFNPFIRAHYDNLITGICFRYKKHSTKSNSAKGFCRAAMKFLHLNFESIHANKLTWCEKDIYINWSKCSDFCKKQKILYILRDFVF